MSDHKPHSSDTTDQNTSESESTDADAKGETLEDFFSSKEDTQSEGASPTGTSTTEESSTDNSQSGMIEDPSVFDESIETQSALGEFENGSTTTEENQPTEQADNQSTSAETHDAGFKPPNVSLDGLKDVPPIITSIAILTLQAAWGALRGLVLSSDREKGPISKRFYPEKKINGRVERQRIPSRWQDVGPYGLAYILIIAAVIWSIGLGSGFVEGYVNSRLPAFITFYVHPAFYLLTPFLFLMGIFTATAAAIHRASTWYILTENQLIVRKKPLNSDFARVNVKDINNIEQEKRIPLRLVNAGTLEIYTAASESSEINIRNINNPGQFETHIDQVRSRVNDEEVANPANP